MDPLTLIVTTIAGWLGTTPTIVLGYIGLIVAIANAISRWVPDDATGALGVIRSICKFIGINVNSRITSGTTVNDVVKTAASFPEVQAKLADKP